MDRTPAARWGGAVTAAAVPLALTGLAVLAAPPTAHGTGIVVRLHEVLPARATGHSTGARTPPRTPRRDAVLLGLLTATAVSCVVGLALGAVAAPAAGYGAYRLRRSTGPAPDRRTEAARHAELPTALDLLAVCLSAGLPIGPALATVAAALSGPLAADLQTVAGLHLLGATPAAAWNEVRSDPLLGPLARAASLSGDSGSTLAAALRRLADEQRADAVSAAEAQARRVGVLALAPLGLCFLPAFLCLGVMPVVLGVAEQVMGAV